MVGTICDSVPHAAPRVSNTPASAMLFCWLITKVTCTCFLSADPSLFAVAMHDLYLQRLKKYALNSEIQNPKTKNPKSSTRTPKSQIQNQKSKIHTAGSGAAAKLTETTTIRNPNSKIKKPKSKIPTRVQTSTFGFWNLDFFWKLGTAFGQDPISKHLAGRLIPPSTNFFLKTVSFSENRMLGVISELFPRFETASKPSMQREA